MLSSVVVLVLLEFILDTSSFWSIVMPYTTYGVIFYKN